MFKKLSIQQFFLLRVLQYGSTFFVNLVLARFLGADEAGRIFFFASNLILMTLIFSVSMDSSFLYYATAGTISLDKLAGFSFVCCLITVACCIGVAFTFRNLFDVSARECLLFLIPYTGGILLSGLYQNILYGYNNFTSPNVVVLVVNLLLLVFIPLRKYNNNVEKENILQLYFFSFFAVGVLMVFIIMFEKKLNPFHFPDRKELKLLYQYAGSALLANLLNLMLYRIDYWFVTYFLHNHHLLGNYIQASKMAQAFLFFSQVLANMYYLIVVKEQDEQELLHITVVLFRVILSTLLFCFLVVLLLPTGIFMSFFGSSFDAMYYPVCLLIPGIISLSLCTITGAFFGGKKMVRINTYSTLAGVVVVIILDLLLIPRYNINGAAAASSIAYTCTFLFSLFVLKKKFNLRLSSLFSFSRKDIPYVVHSLNTRRQNENGT